MSKQAIFQIPKCKTERAMQKRKAAVNKLVAALPADMSHAKSIASALNISRGNAGQILTLKYMSLLHIDKLAQDGYEDFKKIAKKAGVTRSDLSGGAAAVTWSDWVVDYDVKSIKAQFPNLIIRNFDDTDTIEKLIFTFGFGGLSKLFDVKRNTVKNWYTYKKLPIIYLAAIHLVPKLRKEFEDNGFDIWEIDPEVTPEIMDKIKQHHYAGKTAEEWEVISL